MARTRNIGSEQALTLQQLIESVQAVFPGFSAEVCVQPKGGFAGFRVFARRPPIFIWRQMSLIFVLVTV